MKVKLLSVALAILSLVGCSHCFADSNGTDADINDMRQIGLGQLSVNLGGDTASNVNNITFEAGPHSSVLPGTFVSSSAPVSLLQITSDTGSNTGFDWSSQSGEERDAKTSGLIRVPEPTTIALFFAGVGTLLLFRRRRRLAWV